MGLLLWGHVFLVPVLFALTWWDQHTHRLPDIFTLPALALTVLWVAGASRELGSQIVVNAGGALAIAMLGLWLLAEAPGQPLGFGDVKLGALLAAHLGVHSVGLLASWIMVSLLSGGAVAMWGLLTGKMSRHDHMAFGPHLIAGWMLVLAVSPLVP